MLSDLAEPKEWAANQATPISEDDMDNVHDEHGEEQDGVGDPEPPVKRPTSATSGGVDESILRPLFDDEQKAHAQQFRRGIISLRKCHAV